MSCLNGMLFYLLQVFVYNIMGLYSSGYRYKSMDRQCPAPRSVLSTV